MAGGTDRITSSVIGAPATAASPLSEHDASASGTVARFARADRAMATVGLAITVVANAVVVQNTLLWIVPPALVVLVALLTAANRLAMAHRLWPALAAITIGNWLVSIVVPIALPFLWPALVIVAVIPLVLAAPFVTLRALGWLVASAAAVSASVAGIGLQGDDGGAIPDVGDEIELVVVIASIAVLMVPVGLVVWLDNRNQRQALDVALRLNGELQRSQAALAASRRRVVEAADEARSRIERDLHDGAQQRLVAVGMKARLLATRPDVDPMVNDLVAELDHAVDDLRELAHGIYPPVLAAHGVGEALGAAARRSPSRVLVEDRTDSQRLQRRVEEALYFTTLEAMANAAKHAPASDVRVTLRWVQPPDPTESDAGGSAAIELSVEDDGPGLPSTPATPVLSGGVANMRDRIESVGGVLTLTSVESGGVTVQAVVPLPSST